MKREGLSPQIPKVVRAVPVRTGIGPQSLPEEAFRSRPGLWRNGLFPKVCRIAGHKFGNRYI